MARTCTIGLLGGFRVQVDARAVPEQAWRHRRGADLVKLLALATGHRLHREQIMDALWPDLAPDAAAANLRKATHYARRALGSDASIGAERGMLSLWPAEDIVIDAEGFDEAASDALGSKEPRSCVDAAALYGGELLAEDRYAGWSEGPRERLRLRYMEVLKAAGMWERVLEVDRADQEAHRALMQAHLDAGNRQAAIRQFERLRDALDVELGVAPDPTSVALYEKVLAMEGHEPPTPAERARALLAWGLVHWNRMDLEEARRTAEEARALAIDAGLGRELGEASALLGLIAHAKGEWRDLFHTEFLEWVRRPPELASFVFDAHLCLAEFSLYGPGARTGRDVRSRVAPGRRGGGLAPGPGPCESDGRGSGAPLRASEPSRAGPLTSRKAARGGPLRLRPVHVAGALGRGGSGGRAKVAGRALPWSGDETCGTHSPLPAPGHPRVRGHGGGGERSGQVGGRRPACRAFGRAAGHVRALLHGVPGSRRHLLGPVGRSREGPPPPRRSRADRRHVAGRAVARRSLGGPRGAPPRRGRFDAAALFREAAGQFDRMGRPVDTGRCLEAAAGTG